MFYKVHSTVLSALLMLTLAWGHCVVCQPPPQQQDEHGCCPKQKSDNDHCNQPSGKSKQDCPGKAVGAQDYTYKADTGLAAPVLAAPAALAAEPVLSSTQADAIAPSPAQSPPDLCLLNSTLLI